MTVLSPWTLSGLAVTLLLPFKVTGVPPSKTRALAPRGVAYRARQRNPHAFFAGPPRPDPQERTR
jgi:steroid 5-alpha reductase family enzyme